MGAQFTREQQVILCLANELIEEMDFEKELSDFNKNVVSKRADWEIHKWYYVIMKRNSEYLVRSKS